MDNRILQCLPEKEVYKVDDHHYWVKVQDTVLAVRAIRLQDCDQAVLYGYFTENRDDLVGYELAASPEVRSVHTQGMVMGMVTPISKATEFTIPYQDSVVRLLHYPLIKAFLFVVRKWESR